MDSNLHPQEMPRVGGWIMVAPVGTVVPDPVSDGGLWAAAGWSDEWTMPDDIPVMAVMAPGCRVHDDVAFSVTFRGHWPVIHAAGVHMAMVVDDSGAGVRMVMPDVTRCALQVATYHIADGNPPWRVLVAGYYGNPTEVRPYRPAMARG